MFSQNKALVERGHAEVKELQLPLKKNMGVILSTLNTGLRRIAWARVEPTFPLTASPAQPPKLIIQIIHMIMTNIINNIEDEVKGCK